MTPTRLRLDHRTQQFRASWWRLMICTLAIATIYLGACLCTYVHRAQAPEVTVRTVTIAPRETLWDVWSRETDQQLDWHAWIARTQTLNPFLHPDRLIPGQQIRVVATVAREPTSSPRP